MKNYTGFANILVIVVIVLLTSTVGLLAFSKKSYVPTVSSLPVVSATPQSTNVPIATVVPTVRPVTSPSTSNTVSASLGQQFTLQKGQVASITGTGLEITITNFFNSPCPKEVQCFWSGVGMELEYRLQGKVEKGLDLTQAFGYQTTIVQTDHETYAALIINK
jgi:hypothetical protein